MNITIEETIFPWREVPRTSDGVFMLHRNCERRICKMDRLTLTVSEAAKKLGIGQSSAYTAVRNGDIPSVKIGGKYLVPRLALENLLAIKSHCRLESEGVILTIEETIFPLTLNMDRYGGVYSGGAWLAFNEDPWDIDSRVSGSDMECMEYFDEPRMIGRGASPTEAVADLYARMVKQGRITT
jgi:excisionase family DNA binding protein